MTRNPGRVAGLWYLLLVALGPFSLLYVPGKLMVRGNAAATAANIVAHPQLLQLRIVSDLVAAVVLIFLTMAFYRLFKGVDPYLAALVVITGGVMPGLIDFVNAVSDSAALTLAQGADYLAAFDQPQRDALATFFLHLHGQQIVAAEVLWGLWLLPLGLLVYRSRFLPRFIGVWLLINGVAYFALCLTSIFRPDYQDKVFAWSQPAYFGEIALMLWLVIKGARPPAPSAG